MHRRRHRTRRILIAGLLATFLSWCSILRGAQIQASNGKKVSKVGQYVLDVWRIEDGLPQNSISAFAQTPDGYLWMATFDGLVRFDGVRFTVFNPENTKEMKTSRIGGVYVDHSGALWIWPDRTGGETELVKYKDGRFAAFGAAEGAPKSHVVSVDEDAEGTVWFNTESDGLVRLKDGRFTSYRETDGLPTIHIGEIETDGQSNVWVGTEKGLARLKSGRISRYTQKEGLPSDSIGPIYADARGNVWVGTDNGLARFRDRHFARYGVKDGLPDGLIEHIYEDRQGTVWVGQKLD